MPKPCEWKYSAAVMLALMLSLQVGAVEQQAPRLVVLLTIDQLRGDMPYRYAHRFKEGGFAYLFEHGFQYRNAHYRHSTTFTAVGHATLATGGHAAQHGLPGNDWYDSTTGKRVYCVEDPQHHIIGKKSKPHGGTSPRNLTASTIGDELVIASGGRSRVFSVSIKDRGAILPGGHLGKAFWYDKSSGGYQSSTYYYNRYPDWVSRWNARGLADQWLGRDWTLFVPVSRYQHRDDGPRKQEKSFANLGTQFPHPLPNKAGKAYYSSLSFTPMGDSLTVAFVEELLRSENLGQGETLDMLAVSLSATDYIGHAFGPFSREAEDNLLRLDATLARLFRAIDQQVGLHNTLIVLTSDHGVDAMPEYRQALGQTQANRFDVEQQMATLNRHLKTKLKINQDLVVSFWNPSFYLDTPVLQRLRLDVVQVEKEMVAVLENTPGVAHAMSRTDLLSGQTQDSALLVRLHKAFHPTRSGNVLIIQEPYWYLHPVKDMFSAMHGSPHSYDTHVPIIITGPGIAPGVSHRPVAPADIAPTLANYLNIAAPSGATGNVLEEVLQGQK